MWVHHSSCCDPTHSMRQSRPHLLRQSIPPPPTLLLWQSRPLAIPSSARSPTSPPGPCPTPGNRQRRSASRAVGLRRGALLHACRACAAAAAFVGPSLLMRYAYAIPSPFLLCETESPATDPCFWHRRGVNFGRGGARRTGPLVTEV
jgi:hypothetical protein